MAYDDFDILPIIGVRGNLSRARRLVCSGRTRPYKQAGNRRARRAVRTSLRTGDPRASDRFKPTTGWDIA
jgi:hypothetical protein